MSFLLGVIVVYCLWDREGEKLEGYVRCVSTIFPVSSHGYYEVILFGLIGK